jgi:hypothetical protein
MSGKNPFSLIVMRPPPEVFYNQYQGKSHCFETTVGLTRNRAAMTANRSQTSGAKATARYPLTVTLHYDDA